jgi:hypothetical protein
MSFTVGASSGAFGVAGPEEKQQLAGLFNKAQSSITKGVNFVQLDLESLSEFEEPDLEKHMKEDIMKKLNIRFGIHSETKAFGVEAAELDSALETEYDRAQRRLIAILERAGKIGSKYVLIHSSESDPFPLLTLKTQPTELVDFHGKKLKDFLEENKWLWEWVEEKKEARFIWTEVIGRDLDQRMEEIKEEYERDWELTREKQEMPKDYLERRLEQAKAYFKKVFIDSISSRSLHYGPERWAYYLVARWMEENKDPLWLNIVDASIKFFAQRDGITSEQWLAKKKIVKKSIEDENFRAAHEIWVPAVSAKYMWGHLFPKDSEHEDPKEIIKKYNMPLVLESPMGGRGIEEWLRLANPIQYYYLVEQVNRETGSDILMVGLDFEHMLSLRVDPDSVINLLPEDGGKFINVIHAGWPSTLAPAHIPIAIGSDQQQYLYEKYYKLKQKGMGKDREVYLVFERAGPETFQQSMTALKIIADFLERDVKPDDLLKHPDFFGIKLGDMASEARQLTVIKEHAFDPLKGLLMVPEEEHGMLGRAAVERGKQEEWRKERYR